MSVEQSNDTVEFSLASILNILWRRRIIVLGLPILGLIVGLLYGSFGTKRWSATATVRPGITSYSPNGQPFRQWQLRDITTWYDKKLYKQELNRRLGLPKSFKPAIHTEFIATGLTNLSGGEVITLWTTGTSPELASSIIDTSIALFHEYAEADTMSSQIKLTRDGLQLQIKVLETRYLSVDKTEGVLNLELEAARADSQVVAVLDQELLIDLKKIKQLQKLYRKRIENMKETYPVIESELAQIDEIFSSVTANNDTDINPTDIPSWVRRDAILDGGDVMSGLAEVRLRLQQQLNRNTALQDSFSYELSRSILEYERQSLKRESTVQAKLREAEKKIGDLMLERDYELPVKRREVRNDIQSRLVQMGSLTSLQRVGTTIVSDKPVRPRGKRATMILVFLGALGGLVLGFTFDYLMANRKEIFRS